MRKTTTSQSPGHGCGEARAPSSLVAVHTRRIQHAPLSPSSPSFRLMPARARASRSSSSGGDSNVRDVSFALVGLSLLAFCFGSTMGGSLSADLHGQGTGHTPYTLHPTPYTLHPTHPIPHTLHPTPYTLHPTPYTLHPTSYILHPISHTLHRNRKPQILRP